MGKYFLLIHTYLFIWQIFFPTPTQNILLSVAHAKGHVSVVRAASGAGKKWNPRPEQWVKVRVVHEQASLQYPERIWQKNKNHLYPQDLGKFYS